MRTKEQMIAEAREVSARLRAYGAAAQADAVDREIRRLEDGERDSLSVSASYKLTLEKFDGEYEPGKQPVETIVREGAL